MTNNITIPQMLSKLDELYEKEEYHNKHLQQTRADIKLLEYMIMHVSDKRKRMKNV